MSFEDPLGVRDVCRETPGAAKTENLLMVLSRLLTTVGLSLGLLYQSCYGCTNLLLSKGVTTDGSNMIAYNADASNFYTTIYHYPAGKHDTNATRKMWTWDYGTYLGEIPEASETYNVVGNINEHGLIIGESTFGGLVQLACTRRTGLMDYGSLIWVTLQRARNAREAIQVMDYLVQTYGYASTGESFSIADANEIWVMELIGKGRHGKGAVWVARRIPEGYVSGHANQARITTFPLNDPENCKYSPDVISFARDIGLYSGDDESFSFSDIYDPVNFDGARFCEARVWSFFSTVMGEEWSNQYLDYASGTNLTNRMPLWVKPSAKLSLADVMQSMRNHYEGTPLDNTGRLFSDVGAGAFHNPNRNSPIVWQTETYKGEQFFNERTIAQPPTGWSIVMQSRPNFPREMTSVIWYGMDDSSTSVHFPLYGSATRVSEGWAGPGPQDGATPPLMEFSLDSAFYVFNLVANFAYSRWNAIYPDVYSQIISKESEYMKMLEVTDQTGLEMFKNAQSEADVAAAVEYLTQFSVDIGDKLLKDWFKFFGQLFVKYRDGYVTTASPEVPVCGCSVSSLPYEEEWYNRVVEDTGDRYLYPDDSITPPDIDRVTISKKDLRSFR